MAKDKLVKIKGLLAQLKQSLLKRCLETKLNLKPLQTYRISKPLSGSFNRILELFNLGVVDLLDYQYST